MGNALVLNDLNVGLRFLCAHGIQGDSASLYGANDQAAGHELPDPRGVNWQTQINFQAATTGIHAGVDACDLGGYGGRAAF